jgi:hypothetical protein
MVSASDYYLVVQKIPVLQCTWLVHVMRVKMIRLIMVNLLAAGVRPLTSDELLNLRLLKCGKCISAFLEKRYALTQ